jgi:glycosyltransferase involved in cell wall biosynthesis
MEKQLKISVIVPVYNGGSHLRLCLNALLASTQPPTELIVVDDASTDDSSAAAASEAGVKVFSLERREGPAAARNFGAQRADGDVLLFVDADVLVRPETIARLAATFAQDSGLAAIFGSYDDAPAEKNFLSQYKNLFHHFVHQQSSREAATFWAGCGAIRREIFLNAGGFDQVRYERPSVEDIELGYRLTLAGHRIVLDKNLHVKHLKRWNIKSLLTTDVMNRAVPWSQLIMESGRMVNDLNLRVSDRVSAGLTVLSIVALCASLLQPLLLLVVLCLWALIFAVNIKLYGFFLRRKGVGFTALAFFFQLLYYAYSSVAFALCWAVHAYRGSGETAATT